MRRSRKRGRRRGRKIWKERQKEFREIKKVGQTEGEWQEDEERAKHEAYRPG